MKDEHALAIIAAILWSDRTVKTYQEALVIADQFLQSARVFLAPEKRQKKCKSSKR